MDKKYYVYRLTFLEYFYIGFTTDPAKRLISHKNRLHSKSHFNLHFQRVFNKYPSEEIYMTVIKEFESEDLAREFESLEIEKYLEKTPSCLNMSSLSCGGDLLSTHPFKEDIRKSISEGQRKFIDALSEKERKKKYGRSGEQNGMFGKHRTEEEKLHLSRIHSRNKYALGRKASESTKKALSEIAKFRTGDKNPFFGRHHSNESKKKISEMRKGGGPPANAIPIEVDGVCYSSAKEAERVLGIPSVTIRYRCLSKNPKFEKYRIKRLTTIENLETELVEYTEVSGNEEDPLIGS